jgi:methylmalonyl-CoA mutase cobalamin-binding domain/chain
MTINAPASLLLLMYEIVADEQGVAPDRLRGTIQNDVLKEYIARGTYIYPPAPSLRLTADTFAYCAERLPNFNTISISGYHMAEAGATPVQEVAFTLADAIAYVEAARPAGSTSTRSGRACRSSSSRGRRSSRRSRSSGPRVASGPTSCATASVRRTRAR